MSLPPRFLERLAGQDELVVSSREGARVGSVRTWVAVAPDGAVLLFAEAFSVKARRWRSDPWVRLRIPGGGPVAEGAVRFYGPEEVDPVAPLVIARWADWGVTHVEGLRRMLRAGTHVLVRVESVPGGPGAVRAL